MASKRHSAAQPRSMKSKTDTAKLDAMDDAAIATGIAMDEDAWEPTAREMGGLRPASEVVPEIVKAYRYARGRPRKEHPKIVLSVRFSAEVVAHFRATGKGWQTRMDEVLRDYVARQ